MNHVRNVLRRYPEPYKASISSRCNVGEFAIEQWEKRGEVPAKHHHELVTYANEIGLPDITYELLTQLKKRKKAKKRGPS